MDTKRVFGDKAGVEDREHLIAKAEADLSTINHGENWSPEICRPPRQSKGRTFIVFLKDYWWLYTTGLLVAMISLQLAIWHDIRAGLQDCPRQVGGDYTNKGPICLLPNTSLVSGIASADKTQSRQRSYSGRPILILCHWMQCRSSTQRFRPSGKHCIHVSHEYFYEWLVGEKALIFINKTAGAAFVGGPNSDDIYNSTSVTHQLHCVVSAHDTSNCHHFNWQAWRNLSLVYHGQDIFCCINQVA